jgi:hypothetical protein
VFLVNAGEVRKPDASNIQRDSPDQYLTLTSSLGDENQIQEIVRKEISGPKSQAPAKIATYLRQYTFDNKVCYQYRNLDDILQTKKIGSCADYAIAWIALARAKGIPSIFVKTLDLDWMMKWRRKEPWTSWDGHVYVEFVLNGKWWIIDPGADHWTEAPSLGESFLEKNRRWIYDRGPDPQEIILSLDWENWKKQTANYLEQFDFQKIPIP